MDEPFSGLIEAFGNDTWPADFLIGLSMLAFVIAAYLVLCQVGQSIANARRVEPETHGNDGGRPSSGGYVDIKSRITSSATDVASGKVSFRKAGDMRPERGD